MSYLRFNYKTNEKIWGEEKWILSAHENGMSFIEGGEFDGMSLKDFYKENKNLLNLDDDEFPLLLKIIDAKDDLSIQVHPDDEYALKNEDSLGKSEAWYILDTKDSDIVVGQKAKNKEEMSKAIKENKVMEKMNVFDIKKGDFFDIKPGTVHAIRKNTSLLEVQQSSDITYRLFDYNRLGDDGKLRELHIDKSLDVIKYEDINVDQNFNTKIESEYNNTLLTENNYFKIEKIDLNQKIVIKGNADFYILVLLEGEVLINGEKLIKNEAVLVLKDSDITLSGKGSIIKTN